MRIGERAAESALRELFAESEDALGAIGGASFRAAEAVELLDDFVCDVECGVSGGLIPCLGDGGAARGLFPRFCAVVSIAGQARRSCP